jgi:hypothetical protein
VGRSSHAGREALRRALPLPLKRRLQEIGGWGYRSKAAVSRLGGAREESAGEAAALEGVVILGMHRSGTSLVTRLVSLLGLALCREDDLLVGRDANPRGHWESKSLLTFNNRLLEELGGAWFCPPTLEPKALSRLLDRRGAEALGRLQKVHPERPWVWKDPRACVLLPFWSAVLAQRAAYVLVVRHPLEVSDSLASRDGYSPQLSLALWERYTRAAMLGAAGRPMMVCTYDGVLADPVGWSESLLAFLGEAGSSVGAIDPAVAGAFAMDGLRHSNRSWTELQAGALISPEQVALAEIASTFTVQGSYVTPELPIETPTTESIFSEIRSHIAKRDGGPAHRAPLPARLLSERPRAGVGAAVRPAVSIVLAGAAASVDVNGHALAAALPADSELLVFADDRAVAEEWGDLGAVSLRPIDGARPREEAQALALGAQAARGRMVLLSSARLTRCDPWHGPFEQALAAAKVAGVGGAMRCGPLPGRRDPGRALVAETLVCDPAADENAPSTQPVALLSAALCAYDGAALGAAGGVDGCFGSAQAAVTELSVRLWRMGFRCRVVADVEVCSEPGWEDDGDGDGGEAQLYDRMRIAALHFDAVRLRGFMDRISERPGYEQAVERLAASDVERRRAAIAAVCAYPIERYFEEFPLPV